MSRFVVADPKKCIGCKSCSLACPMEAMVIEERKAVNCVHNCILCGVCISKCPEKAIRYGRKDVSELLLLVKQDNIRYLLISTLMLPSALKVKDVTTGLLGEDVTVIVGGAPFRIDPELGKEVGADWVCFTASDAVTAIRKLEGSP